MNKGQTALSVLMWAIGLMATASIGFNGYNANVNAKQDDKISGINREVGEYGIDIKYIRANLDEMKANQAALIKAQGLTWRAATST